MGKLIEKIKEVFTGKFVYTPKKTKESQPSTTQPKSEKQEEKPKEQK